MATQLFNRIEDGAKILNGGRILISYRSNCRYLETDMVEGKF
jgi:hypothetical protein